LRGIYQTKGDSKNFSYWDEILKKLEENKAYLQDKWPDFLMNMTDLSKKDTTTLNKLLSNTDNFQ
jgi:hypothetical protein